MKMQAMDDQQKKDKISVSSAATSAECERLTDHRIVQERVSWIEVRASTTKPRENVLVDQEKVSENVVKL